MTRPPHFFPTRPLQRALQTSTIGQPRFLAPRFCSLDSPRVAGRSDKDAIRCLFLPSLTGVMDFFVRIALVLLQMRPLHPI